MTFGGTVHSSVCVPLGQGLGLTEGHRQPGARPDPPAAHYGLTVEVGEDEDPGLAAGSCPPNSKSRKTR